VCYFCVVKAKEKRGYRKASTFYDRSPNFASYRSDIRQTDSILSDFVRKFPRSSLSSRPSQSCSSHLQHNLLVVLTSNSVQRWRTQLIQVHNTRVHNCSCYRTSCFMTKRSTRHMTCFCWRVSRNTLCTAAKCSCLSLK
jgi:hypothetical protein